VYNKAQKHFIPFGVRQQRFDLDRLASPPTGLEPLAHRPWLIFGFVFLIDLGIIALTLLDNEMAVAQPIGTKGIENLVYTNAEAGKTGPFALQMHNGGLFDEYRNLRIEVDPKADKLITAE